MRVRCAKDAAESPSIVLLKQSSVPAFKMSEDATRVVVATSKMQAVFDRRSGALHFTDHAGKTFLSEIAGTRRLAQSTVQGEPTFAAEEDFISPPGEHLFGSGEFRTASLISETFPGD
jgi:alpha-D-xyloside xylohydrolase